MISILDKALQAILKMLQQKDERVLLGSITQSGVLYKILLLDRTGIFFRHLVILFGAQYLLTRQVFSLTMDRIHLLSITQIWIIRRVFRREYGL